MLTGNERILEKTKKVPTAAEKKRLKKYQMQQKKKKRKKLDIVQICFLF